ncbi:MAG: hypothetical protein ISR98_00640 [Parcubacteria group bacterium]|nr:hypothetical protein [Parcubacteria group bacterium]
MFTRHFKSLTKNNVNVAGGKGASLGEMTQENISVPEGFVILTDTFEKFLDETDLRQEIRSELNDAENNKIHTVEKASKNIQNLILSKEISKNIKEEIQKEFKNLNIKYVAVRSSATAEDSKSAAWAGQLDTFLNTTEDKLLENVKRCWASLFTPRAIFYRFEQGLKDSHVSVAVVIQKMIDSEKSGIAFSVHPVTEDSNQLIIEAGFGLGEAVVSGSITPDAYTVSKKDNQIIDINVNEQTKALYRNKDGGNTWQELKEKGKEQVLTEEQIIELSNLIKQIENHYSSPQDIEWAYENSKFYITQSRPITTLGTQVDQINAEELNYNQIDWAHYLDRPTEFFLTNILVKEFKGAKLKQVFGFGHDYWLFLYNGGETMDLYRRVDELQESDRFTKEFIKEKSKVKKLFAEAKNVIANTETMIDSYKKRKDVIKTLPDFKKEYQRAIQQIIDYFVYIIEIPYIIGSVFEIDDVAKEAKYQWILKECEKLRSLSYHDFHQYVLSYLLDSLVTILDVSRKDIAFTTSDEIFSFLDSKLTKQELLNTTQQRKNNFVGFSSFGKEKFFHDESFLKSFYPEVDESIRKIKGNIAQKGLVTGRVKVVISKNDFTKFEDGDILVTIQSNPSFMPVIVKCSAIIADEGGIMSHAAIVSRELDKPCIIGTKVATKILKDGDMVEVDADNGVVRILEKEKINKNIKKIQQALTKNGPLSKTITYPFTPVIWFEAMMPAYISNPLFSLLDSEPKPLTVALIDDEFEAWSNLNLIPVVKDINIIKEIDKKTLEMSSRIKKSFEEILQISDKDLKSPQIFIETLQKANDYTTEIYYHFAFYIDESFETNDEKLIHKLQETRMILDGLILNYHYKVYGRFIDVLINEYNFPREIVERMTTAEIIQIVQNPQTIPDFEEIISRPIAFIHLRDKLETITGDDIFVIKEYLRKQNPHDEIVHDANNNGVLKGATGNKGITKGLVQIITAKEYHDKEKLEALSKKKGFVLVIPMTSPELVPYFKNANAFVTDEGGITCHAAIIARELGIPCVVGTKVATEVFKDGDIVKVDANNGVIRIIKE